MATNEFDQFDAPEQSVSTLNIDALPQGLKPLAKDFEQVGNKYGIDPNFLASIAWNETGGGTSRAFREGNNAMGISNASGPVYGFNSPAESIERQAATLARPNGPYRGASTIREVGSIYSPVGAANDPYHQNADWTQSVGSYYNKLTGRGNNAPVLGSVPTQSSTNVFDQFDEQSESPIANQLTNYVQNNIGKVSTRDIPGTEGGNLGCAAAVCKVFKNATGEELVPNGTLSTGEEWNHLTNDPRFQALPVDKAQPGDIIVTAAGAKHGHTGFVLPNGEIASNNSSNGILEKNYDLQSWMDSIGKRNPQQTAVFRYVGGQTPQTSTNVFDQFDTSEEAQPSAIPSPTPEQTGKAINLPATPSKEQNVFDKALEQYPKLKDANAVGIMSTNTQDGANMLESWPAGETGTTERPRPKELPQDKLGVQIFNQKTTPDDVAADIVSHSLVKTDPNLKATYDQFASSLTPKQTDFLKGDYENAVKNEGETRPFDQWMKTTGIPAAFRGYAFGQYKPEDQQAFGYTDQQKQLLGSVKPYLQGEQQEKVSPETPYDWKGAAIAAGSTAVEQGTGLLAGPSVARAISTAVPIPIIGPALGMAGMLGVQQATEYGIKKLEEFAGYRQQIEEAQQAHPTVSTVTGYATMAPFAITSLKNIGADFAKTLSTDGATAAAKQLAGKLVSGAIGGSLLGPIRYGLENIEYATGIKKEKPTPITGREELENGIIGAILSGHAEAEKKNKVLGGPEPTLTPSKNPIVNQREEEILASADAQAPVPEVPITPEPIAPAKAPTADLNSLIAEQLFHDEGSPEYKAIQDQIDALKEVKPAEAPVAEAKPTDVLSNSIVHTVRNNEDIPNIINNGLRAGSNITINPTEPNQSFGGQTVTLVFDKPNVSFEAKGYNPNDGIVTERNPSKPKAALIDSEAINLLTSESLNPQKINDELTDLYSQLDQERKSSSSDPNAKKNVYGRTAKESELERKIDEKNNQLQEALDYIDQNPEAKEKPGVSREQAISELTKHIPKDIPVYSYDLSEKETPINLKLEQPTEESKNAVQEPSAREVGVRNPPAVGEGMGAENKPEVPATEGQAPKEEVKPEEPSQLELWADNTIKESRKRLNVGLDPEVLTAYAVKGAFKIARGVRDFAAWSKEMLADFGEGIRPHLEDLWNQAKQIHTEREKYTPKEATEQEAFAKKAADAFLKGRGTPITEEELSSVLARKFPGISQGEISDLFATASGKPKPPAPYAGVAAGQETPFGISRAAQERMVESGELSHVSPSAEPVTQQDRLAKAEQALDSGSDPEQVIKDLQAANITDKIAQGMVYANQLKNAASNAMRKYGYNSSEFKEAQKAHQDYQDRLKEAGSSQAGSALQIVGAGAKLNEARLIDTYDFANAFHEQTKGQDMTLSQIDKASKFAERNKKAEEETKKAQNELSNIRDEGFSDVDVKIPETMEDAREQVGDLSDAAGKATKDDIDRVNNELEQTKKDLEEVRQAKATGQDAESLKAYYEAKLKDLEDQLKSQPKYGKEVFEQARKIVDRWKADAAEAEKLLSKQLSQMGSSPDPTIIATLARIMRAHIGELALDFTESSARLVAKFGPKIKPFLKEAWDKAQELIKGETGGAKAAKTVGKAKAKAKVKPVEKMTPAEKAEDSLRKRIAQAQKKIDDFNSGKIVTPKEVEKVTSDEINRLEAEYNQKKKELADARLKSKQNQTFPKGKEITGKLNIEQAKTLWESAKKFYIPRMTEDAFYDEHRLIADMADDFGLSPEQVREAFAMPKGAKKAAGNLFLEQQKRMQVLNNSRRWLLDQSANMIGKLLGKAAEQAFRLSVLGHGTAFITTHALPLWATNPVLGTKAFLRALRYTFTGRSGRKQWIIDNNSIVNHPDYEWALKGGAEVNPFKYGTEKPQRSNPDSLLAKALDPITGGRGFDALHYLRMQYFSKEWRKLSPAMRTEEMAKIIGEAANTATGYAESKLGSHPIIRLALFAPKLYKSQFKWLIGDPLKMTSTFAKMATRRNVSAPEAWQARHEFVNKAKFIGMYASALGLNQLILTAAGSNAQINFTDPKKHDWLAFKTGDGSFNPLHPFIALGRLTAKITHDLFSDYAPLIFGKKTNLEKVPGNNIKLALHDIGDYAFGKLSPIARQAAVLVNQRDFAGNAVPWSSVAPLRGKEKLTWPQYVAEMYSPIPFAEASTQKEWISKGAAEKLGSALIFGAPYETKEDEEKWAKSHAAVNSSSSVGTGPYGLKKSGGKPYGLQGSSSKPYGLK